MTQPLPQAVPESEQDLLVALGEMASTPEAARFLEEIAEAMFPDGVSRDKIVWPERTNARVDHSPEGELLRLRARFQTLVEQIPAVTFLAVLGEGDNDIYVSPHVEQLLGYSQQEWLDNPFLWYWQLHPDDRQLWNDVFAKGVRTGGPFVADCRFFARDGRIVWVHGEARLVRDARGRPQFLQGVAFDITDAKNAEEVLLRTAVQEAKRAEELEIARRVQTSIVPRSFAVGGLEIAAMMRPADEVGGDYYDVIPSDDGAWIGIGDVTGHGLNAGLVMMMVQSAMKALAAALPGIGPAELFRKLNGVLHDNVRNRLERDDHVTFSVLRYKHDGSFAFAGAHEDMLVYRRATRSVDVVSTPGPWLAAKRDLRASVVESTLQLAPGDVLVLYTDGITEARDARGVLFDIDRLERAVAAIGDAPVQQVLDHLIGEVDRHMARQDDDISLVVVRYVGRSGP
jgi:PAS domain S-box-containing protein